MRKMYWLGLVLLFSLLVTGCAGQSSTTESTSVPTAENTEVVVPATEASSSTEAATEAAAEVVECQPYNLLDQILPAENTTLPPVSEENDHIAGPADAKMVIIEYSDFQCPYCEIVSPVLLQFQENHPDEVRFVYRHFPLSYHDKGLLAATAAEAAGLQDKFFEMESVGLRQRR